MNLGERIYRFRTEKNLSQGDLADRLEVSRQSISKWETNASVPELDKLIKLSEIFAVTLDELVMDKKPEQDFSQNNASFLPKSVDSQTLPGVERVFLPSVGTN